jgi:hypothetical protein
MFRRLGLGTGNQECAAGGDAIVDSDHLVVGKVKKETQHPAGIKATDSSYPL